MMNSMICTICERRCRLREGQNSGCGLYEVRQGEIVERFPDRYLVACPLSIETMPMLHFRPGGKFLQISTSGCNFDCPGCISAVLVREISAESTALHHLSAEEVVAKAVNSDCEGIVFLMNDPLAAYHSFLKVARQAHARGLAVGCSTNGYFSADSLAQLLPFLDFINFGLKGFSDEAYRACGAAGLQPVLRNIQTVVDSGRHVEVSCVYRLSQRDELITLAHYLAGVDGNIPLQVMRFMPFEDAAPEEEPSIRETEALCEELGSILDYVYLFNTPGTPFLHTRCPECHSVAVRREFYGPMGAKLLPEQSPALKDNRCVRCGRSLPFVGRAATTGYRGGDFQGGYPLTRAMEMVEAMLISLGVNSREQVVAAWEKLLTGDGLELFHRQIQQPRSYIAALRDFGYRAGRIKAAEELTGYLEHWLAWLETRMVDLPQRPRVYYAMGKPLYYFNGGRLENRLVELAGGISLNQHLPLGGRPGRSLTVDELNRLNPEVIVLSAFITNTVEDVMAECQEMGIDIDAVRNRRIIVHPAPGWDFGSPRWILGLLHLATSLQPDRCVINVMAEARQFYRRFYHQNFDAGRVNRSFAKPSVDWKWQTRQKCG